MQKQPTRQFQLKAETELDWRYKWDRYLLAYFTVSIRIWASYSARALQWPINNGALHKWILRSDCMLTPLHSAFHEVIPKVKTTWAKR